MNPKEEIYLLIDQYLNNQLSEAEREAFEKRCESDPEFAKEVKLQTQAEYVVRVAGREERRNAFNQVFEDIQQEAPVMPFWQNRRWQIGLVAAAIALLFLFFGRNLISPKTDPESLFAQNFTSLSLSIDRSQYGEDGRDGENSSIEDTWLDGAELYQIKEYEQAIPLLEKVVSDESFKELPKAHLYLGLAYLEAYKRTASPDKALLEKAIKQLEDVPSQSYFIDDADWYQALALLGLGDKEAALVILEEMVKDGYHYKSDIAKKIIDNL